MTHEVKYCWCHIRECCIVGDVLLELAIPAVQAEGNWTVREYGGKKVSDKSSCERQVVAFIMLC